MLYCQSCGDELNRAEEERIVLLDPDQTYCFACVDTQRGSHSPTSYWRFPETHDGDVMVAHSESEAEALANAGCDEITENEYRAALGEHAL